jgi:hypothetical protein
MTSIVGGTTGITFPDSTVQTTAATTPTAVANLSGGAAGKIPFQTGASTTSFTAAGTSGQVLTSAGTGTPTWSTPSAGAMTLISTQTVSNVTGVTFNNISSTYNSYELIYQGVYDSSSSSFYLRLQMVCSGTIDTNGAYYYGNVLNNGTGTYPIPSYGLYTTAVNLTNLNGSAQSNTHNGKINLYTISNNSAGSYGTHITSISNSGTSISSGVWNTAYYNGAIGLNQTATGIYLFDANGAYMNGTFSLYGITS